MIKTLIVLPNGNEIFSGNPTGTAILSKTLTKSVNDGAELKVGSVCASMLDAKIIVPQNVFSISEGSELSLFDVDDSGSKTLKGIFICEKPSREKANTYRITAYDRIVKLDKDLTEWLSGLSGWPYTLYSLASMVCSECGITLKNTSIPNGDRLVQKFTGNVTGRTLMKYIGQACCRFGRATPDGEFEFAWYSDSGKTLGATDIRMDGISYEDYVTQTIERVQIRATRNDIGTIYPQDGENTYVIEGNPLLVAESADDLQGVVETIYSELSTVAYTPCKCSLFYPSGVDAGDIVTITDRNGVTITSYVMSSTVKGMKQTIQCVGSYSRESVTFVNNEKLDDPLAGRVTEIEKSVEGLRVTVSQVQTEQEETTRKITELNVTADGLSSEISKQTTEMDNIRTELTAVQQSSNEVSVKVQSIVDNGVSKVTNEFGLTIDESAVTIHREGSDMTNSLDETGMYVIRNKGQSNEQVMLEANVDGVKATNVTVYNYLTIGHARFEEYKRGTDSERTGCFWV